MRREIGDYQCLALLTSVVASEGEHSGAHHGYDALLPRTALYFLSQLCGVCIRIETLLLVEE